MLQTIEVAVPEGTIRLERNLAEVNVEGSVADEKWREIDSNGHEHYYSDAKDPDMERGGHYPTLIYVPGPVYYCGECSDEHEDYAISHYECRICGDTVEPGSREPNNPEALVLTRMSVSLNGEYITKERAEELLSAAKTAEANDGTEYRINLS